MRYRINKGRYKNEEVRDSAKRLRESRMDQKVRKGT